MFAGNQLPDNGNATGGYVRVSLSVQNRVVFHYALPTSLERMRALLIGEHLAPGTCLRSETPVVGKAVLRRPFSETAFSREFSRL